MEVIARSIPRRIPMVVWSWHMEMNLKRENLSTDDKWPFNPRPKRKPAFVHDTVVGVL